MNWRLLIVVVLLLMAPHRGRGQDAGGAMRFSYLDLFVDANEPVAAWQVEVTGAMKVVGIEGGDTDAFQRPPFYDPAAMGKGRVIVGAYSTGDNLPAGRFRIARIHIASDREIAPGVKLMAAANRDGRSISPAVSLMEGEAK